MLAAALGTGRCCLTELLSPGGREWGRGRGGPRASWAGLGAGNNEVKPLLTSTLSALPALYRWGWTRPATVPGPPQSCCCHSKALVAQTVGAGGTRLSSHQR